MSVIITLNSNEKEDLRYALEIALGVFEKMKMKPKSTIETIKKTLKKISPEGQERIKNEYKKF